MTEAIGGNVQADTALIARWQDSGAAERANFSSSYRSIATCWAWRALSQRSQVNPITRMYSSAASRFANQNVVCRLREPRTIEFLKQAFSVDI